MKRILLVLLAVSLLMVGCATFVRIDSNVPNAKVSVNGIAVGKTPAEKSLSDFVASDYSVTLEAEGYQKYQGHLKKEIKLPALVGGLFLWPFLLWTYGPVDAQYFELTAQ